LVTGPQSQTSEITDMKGSHCAAYVFDLILWLVTDSLRVELGISVVMKDYFNVARHIHV
jgi:hypothetical protein